MSRSVIALTLLTLLTTGSTIPAEGHEYRYRLSGAIRPLLFWIGDDDVGSARIVRRDDGESCRGYELLIGSDPNRAPRGTNKWGWVFEELREDGATQRGLMRKIDEESLEEAKDRIGVEGEYIFKAIRTEIAGDQARAENTVWVTPDDYTFYDLGAMLRLIEDPPQAPPQVNQAPFTPGTHPGILFAAADLVDRAVAAAAGSPRELLQKVTTHFNFNAIRCDLTLRETKWEDSKEYGDRRYERLVRLELESYDPEHDDAKRFTVVCGTEGEWKGVPVYMKFQPKWWFRVEGVIDESQIFERAQQHALRSETGGAEGKAHVHGFEAADTRRAPNRTQRTEAPLVTHESALSALSDRRWSCGMTLGPTSL